ncbi:hypothetical protein CTAYLR_001935 [Chrysophaeum taylorii]|uniref:DNA 3'-5' helicase n=1 Tax=Chrysophaeum taylorii TaxID=2483200 RepID=A0AAD7UAJ1_9STRA|nr:hypothetical protein CTAYLR_001935 [Chrysophaeum taylorii]
MMSSYASGLLLSAIPRRVAWRRSVTMCRHRRTLTAAAAGWEDDSDEARERALAAAVGGATGRRRRKSLPLKIRRLVAYRQKYACASCGVLLPPNHQVDHVVPAALNGSDALPNLQALCLECHKQKTREQRHEILRTTQEPRRRDDKARVVAVEKEVAVELNEAQRKAVELPGPIRVVAGPGTGKTRVLTSRIEELLRRGERSILALTFTNKAANEMRERLARVENSESVSVGTFHRVCLSILRHAPEERAPGFACYDQTAMIKLTRYCIESLLGLDAKEWVPSRVQALISEARNARERLDGTLGRIMEAYEEELKRRNVVDFDDMLLLGLKSLERTRRRRWRHVLVDEFQDSNSLQYEFLKLLSDTPFAVGDSDQAIYGWRGADYDNLRKFDADFPGRALVTLDQNYRSSQQILDAAASLIAAAGQPRDDIKLQANIPPGPIPTLVRLRDQDAEARFVADLASRLDEETASIAVVYRTNAQSRAFETQLLRHGVPYHLASQRAFFERREVRDVLAYLTLVVSDDDDSSLDRVLNVPPRAVGEKSRALLLDAAAKNNGSLAATIRDPPPGLFPRALKGLEDLVGIIDDLRRTLAATETTTKDLSSYLARLLEITRYDEYVQAEVDNGVDRWRNLRELANLAAKYDVSQILEFLDDCALVQDQDALETTEISKTTTKVHLLTIHAAKGLEYDVVFVAGCEDGLLPHFYALEEGDLREERRLLYVAMTRAKRRLYLLCATTRLTWGITRDMKPSTFLGDIPSRQLDLVDLVATTTRENSAKRHKGGKTSSSSSYYASLKPGDSRRRQGRRQGGGKVQRAKPSDLTDDDFDD